MYILALLSCSLINAMQKMEILSFKQQKYVAIEPDFFSPRLKPSPRDLESPTSQKVMQVSHRRKVQDRVFFKAIGSSLMSKSRGTSVNKDDHKKKSEKENSKNEVNYSTIDLVEKIH